MFRDRCLALKMACEDAAREPSDFVVDGRVMSAETQSAVDVALFKYEIRRGVAHRRFHKATKTFQDKPLSESFARSRQALDRLVSWYFRRIAKVGGVEFSKTRRSAEHRGLFVADFEQTAGYTTLCFELMGTKPRKVTRIWKRKYRPRKLIVDVALTQIQLKRGLPRRIWKKLRFANPRKESAFPARISNVDYAIAESLAKLVGSYIRRGFFDTARRPKEFT